MSTKPLQIYSYDLLKERGVQLEDIADLSHASTK